MQALDTPNSTASSARSVALDHADDGDDFEWAYDAGLSETCIRQMRERKEFKELMRQSISGDDGYQWARDDGFTENDIHKMRERKKFKRLIRRQCAPLDETRDESPQLPNQDWSIPWHSQAEPDSRSEEDRSSEAAAATSRRLQLWCRLRRNQVVRAEVKLVADALASEIAMRKSHGESGPYVVYRSTPGGDVGLVQQTGLSASTVTVALDRLEKMGAIAKRPNYKHDGLGRRYTHGIKITLLHGTVEGFLEYLGGYNDRHTARGGQRPGAGRPRVCAHHPSATVDDRSTCTECGDIFYEKARRPKNQESASVNASPEPHSATDASRTEIDRLSSFVAECCVVADHARATSSELWDAYTKWCVNTGERLETRTAFGIRLREKGFQRVRARTGANWLGIGLSDDRDGLTEERDGFGVTGCDGFDDEPPKNQTPLSVNPSPEDLKTPENELGCAVVAPSADGCDGFGDGLPKNQTHPRKYGVPEVLTPDTSHLRNVTLGADFDFSVNPSRVIDASHVSTPRHRNEPRKDCQTCNEQWFGGPRCYEHNKLPVDDRPHVLRNGAVS